MKKLQNLTIMNGTGRFLHLYKAEYDADGVKYPYEVVSRKILEKLENGKKLGESDDAVCIVPIFENGDVLAIKEFRYAINDYILEFPAGLIDPGEDAVKAAIRELKEETGLETKKVLFNIPGGYSSAGMTDERVAVVGLLVKGTYHDVHGKEEISSFKTTVDDLFERITAGEKCSARMQCILLGMKMYHLLADVRFSPNIKK